MEADLGPDVAANMGADVNGQRNERDGVNHARVTRTLALGGVVGPWLWTLIVLFLTFVEYDTLTAFGWTPGQDHGVNYPSSLALGPVGWLQMANFAVFGVLTLALAVALYRAVRPRLLARIGPILLGVAGVGLVLSAFPTDHGPPDGPATWHGTIHNLAFVATFVPQLFAFFLLAASFRGDPRWRGYEWLGPAVGLAAVGSLVGGGSLLPLAVNQIAFYVALLLLFAGLTLIGLRLRTVAARGSTGVRTSAAMIGLPSSTVPVSQVSPDSSVSSPHQAWPGESVAGR